MSDGLVRVTAVAGTRRSDLAVPGAVALAELLPDLARAVGLLDPAAAYAGHRVLAHGRRLRADQGLREQGVGDGALLAVAAVADDPPVPTHDDLVEVTADAVRGRRAWEAGHTRRTTLVGGLLAVAAGGGIAATDAVGRVVAGWSMPGGSGVTAAIALVLVVLAGHALPAFAVAAGVARADVAPIDVARVEAMVRRAGRVLVAGSVAVAALTAALVPAVATDPPGAALVLTCCGVLLLRARRHRGFAPALADVAGGLAVLVATILTLVVRQPDQRDTLAAALALAGCVACALARLPAAPSPLRARALDLAETILLVALAPLLLVATDGLALVGG